MNNKKFLYLMITILLIAFSGAYYSLDRYMNKNDLKFEASNKLPFMKLTDIRISDYDENLKQSSVTTNLTKVTGQTKFTFVIKYKDKEVRNMVLEKQFNASNELDSKTKEELNDLFKKQGYIVYSMSVGQVDFVNNSDRYSYNANRYFLGIYNDLVTIYKTDNNGDIIAHKIFNANVDAEDGTQRDYDFETEDKGELIYIKTGELKEKDGVLDDLIFGKKYVKDTEGPIDMEESEEKGEFKTAGKAFDYARGLLRS
ncbi:hypothetical protein [Clostridium sp.]|uniref:hypothetical protein n=1 Tax=Clostridium sp. TaxID=1506 RepID=UPI001A3C5881|nr:hypothetical protein [Clostridium sp.]MBK5241633.1 hypothetical protein [Clostridium sp.]